MHVAHALLPGALSLLLLAAGCDRSQATDEVIEDAAEPTVAVKTVAVEKHPVPRELVLTGRSISAHEALELHLVSRVVTPETVVEVALSREMEGELRPAGGGGAPLGRLRPGRPFRGELERGDHELAVRATRRDEGRRYRIAVRPEAWVDGMRRAITLPAELPVSVGEESMIELAPRGLLSAPFPLVSGPIDRDDVYGSPG